jgi:hypothetical protein
VKARSKTGKLSPSPLTGGERRHYSRQERNLILIMPVPTSKALVFLIGVLLVVADIIPFGDFIKIFI